MGISRASFLFFRAFLMGHAATAAKTHSKGSSS